MPKGQVIYIHKNFSPVERAEFKRYYNFIKMREGYRHYGIDAGDGKVILFFTDNIFKPEVSKIQLTTMERFLDEKPKKIDYIIISYNYDPVEVAKRAKSLIGSNFGGYHLFNNNCEHFAVWCATGKWTSRQVYFTNDDQDIVEKAVDRFFEPLVDWGAKLDERLSEEEKLQWTQAGKLVNEVGEEILNGIDSMGEVILNGIKKN